MDGRELILWLGHEVHGLCEMVSGWRAEQDTLRARIAKLETPDAYRGSKTELADRIQDLWDSGGRPQA